jgi:hypothetical protein
MLRLLLLLRLLACCVLHVHVSRLMVCFHGSEVVPELLLLLLLLHSLLSQRPLVAYDAA